MTRLAALAVVVSLACVPAAPAPRVRVVSAAPTGAVAPDEVVVELAFSGPIDAAGFADGGQLGLGRREDLRALEQQAESEGGLASGPVIPSRVTVEDGGRRVLLRPLEPLAPEALYAAVLSRLALAADGRAILDPEGKSRAFAVLFETGPAVDRAPPRPRWLVPPHGPVPLDAAELRVAFDEPVEGALALGGSSPAGRAVTESPEVLGLDLAAGLTPGLLAVDLGGVRDAAGNAPLALEPLTVSGCPSGGSPAVEGAARVIPGELSLTLRASLATMGRLLAEVSALPGDPACGAAPGSPAVALTRGDVLPCPGWDPCASAPAPCPGEVTVGGLCPGTTVQVRLLAEDLARHRSVAGPWLQAASLPPRPAPVLSEVLADADTPEAGGEYVEVANLGTGQADLTGHVLAKRTSSGAFTRCTLAQLAGGAIPAGGHALLVGGSYDGRYALAPGTPIYRCGASALAGGLANDRAPALALEDPQGLVVSSAGLAEPAARCAEGALERIHPAGPDASANWACPAARTPGACNRSTPAAECPRRPW